MLTYLYVLVSWLFISCLVWYCYFLTDALAGLRVTTTMRRASVCLAAPSTSTTLTFASENSYSLSMQQALEKYVQDLCTRHCKFYISFINVIQSQLCYRLSIKNIRPLEVNI